MINLFFEDVTVDNLDDVFYFNWLSNTCLSEGKSLEEVNIIFSSDEYLLAKNIEFLQHDYYTDIITFDYCVGNNILGDLFVSVDRVAENATDNNVDFIDELNRVIVHGVLHLCGYKDKSEADAVVMRSKEDLYLSKIVPRGTM
jgi:probable rRNA maturation factor